MLLLGLATAGASARTAKQQAEERRIADARRQAAEQRRAAEDAELKAHAAEAAEQAASALKVVETSIAGQDFSSAKKSLQTAGSIISKYQGLNPPLPAFVAFTRELQQDKEDLAAIDNAQAVLDGSQAKLAEAASKAKEGDYVGADDILDDILRKSDVPERAAQHLPMKDIKKLRTTVEGRRKALAPKVKQQRAAQAAAEAYRTICGEAPTVSAWDGEIIGLERHIKETAHDPKSIDVEKCTTPRLTEKNCWVSSCNVRGKNAFGALILQRNTYSFSKLGIEQLR